MLIDTTALELLFKERTTNPTTVDTTQVPRNRDEADILGAARQDLMFLAEQGRIAFASTLAGILDRYADFEAGIEADKAAIEGQLTTFHEVEISVAKQLQQPPPLNIELDHVELHSQEGQPKWVYFDEKAFTAAVAEAIPTAVKPPVVAIDKNVAKKVLGEHGQFVAQSVTYKGETVPGVRVEPATRKFWVS